MGRGTGGRLWQGCMVMRITDLHSHRETSSPPPRLETGSARLPLFTCPSPSPQVLVEGGE